MSRTLRRVHHFDRKPLVDGPARLLFPILVGGQRGVADLLAFVNEDVAAAEDADRPAGVVNHRRGRDAAVGQQRDRLLNGNALIQRHRIGGHQVLGRRMGQRHSFRGGQRVVHGNRSCAVGWAES